MKTPKIGSDIKRRERIDLFLSYCPEDVEIAERLEGILGRLDYNVWYAPKSVPPGKSIVGATYGAMAIHHTALVLVSQNSVKSRSAEHEMNTLMNRSLSLQNLLVVPLIFDGCETPLVLQDIRIINMEQDFEGGIIDLLSLLRTRFGK